ncbi:glycosyltransferase [bacterium]|nr:glycosyltransferase [bacterium]
MTLSSQNRPISGKKISIVTVCRNSQATIRKTVESVLSQDYSPLEYTVIDGNSQDHTLSILKEYSSQLNLISEPDKGYYDAANKALKIVTGDWIHFLNSDDFYENTSTLNRTIPYLKAEALNYGSISRILPNGSKKNLPFRYDSRWPWRNKKWQFWFTTSMLHPSMIISKHIYEAIGQYSVRWQFSSDIDLILRILKQFPLNYVPEMSVSVLQGGMSQKHREKTAVEFAEVTAEHGFPKPLALAILKIKLKLLWPAIDFFDEKNTKQFLKRLT